MRTQDGRRGRVGARIPFDAIVEVGTPKGADFEAQAVDLSEGGMHLRTAYLPELGRRLLCRFDAGGRADVVVEGEVVWAAEAARGGEFGIRFDGVDPQSAEALARLIGYPEPEDAATPDDPKPPLHQSAHRVRLHIDGLDAPMRARIKHGDRRELTVGSKLGFLQVGRSIELEHPDTGDRRAATIDRVDVEIDQNSGIPQLVVTLAYVQTEVDLGSAVSQEASSEPVRGHVVPAEDMRAHGDRHARAEHAVSERGMSGRASEIPPPPDPRPTDTARKPVHHEARMSSEPSPLPPHAARMDSLVPMTIGDPEPFDTDAPHHASSTEPQWADGHDDSISQTDRHAQGAQRSSTHPTMGSRAPSRARLEMADDAESTMGADQPHAGDGDDAAHESHAAHDDAYAPETPAAKRGAGDLEVVKASAERAKDVIATGIKEIGPIVSSWARRAKTTFKLIGGGKAESKQKRVTSPPPGGGLHAEGHRIVRTPAAKEEENPKSKIMGALASPKARKRAFIGAAGAGIALIAVLALARGDGADPPTPAVARTTSAPDLPDDTGQRAPAPPPTGVAASEPAEQSPSGVIEAEPTVDLDEPPRDRVEPLRPRSEPASPKKPSKAPASFGTGRVGTAIVMRLKMDGPIEAIQGARAPHGFTVVIPDRRSLEPAGPLAEKDPRIDAIRVLNRPHGAELDVAFKDGVPNYEVRARGDTLEIRVAKHSGRTRHKRRGSSKRHTR